MPVKVLDLEQSLLLLELEAPFDKRQVQLARRRMAKRWHPDIAPPGRQHEHERHLKAINEAADQLERLAEELARRQGVAQRGARQRDGRAQGARGGGAPQLRGAAARAGRRRATQKQRSVRRARPRPLGRPPLRALPLLPGVGRRQVQGIYFTGEGDDVQQWARVKFQVGIRTVPAGSLQFVDFSTPDPGHERVERFMTAAQHAIAEENYALAAQRAGLRARRAARATRPCCACSRSRSGRAGVPRRGTRRARLDPCREEPAGPYRFASRIYEDLGAFSSPRSRPRVTRLTPRDGAPGSGWAGCACGAGTRRRAQGARARRAARAVRRGLLDLALANQLLGDVGGEVSACEAATLLDPSSPAAWSRYAHALARTDRSPTVSRPATARSPSATTRRSATCSTASWPRRRASCTRRPRPRRSPRARGLPARAGRDAVGGSRTGGG